MSFVLTTGLEQGANRSLPAPLPSVVTSALEHVREGCFQRTLCFVVSVTSVASGLEVGYEHYKGSYSNPVMYTPVALSGALAGAGLLGVFSRLAARTVLRWVSIVTLTDGVVGFFFHVRGVARKPGGWSLPVANIVMGPPIFAPPTVRHQRLSGIDGILSAPRRRSGRCYGSVQGHFPNGGFRLADESAARKIPKTSLRADSSVGLLQWI